MKLIYDYFPTCPMKESEPLLKSNKSKSKKAVKGTKAAVATANNRTTPTTNGGAGPRIMAAARVAAGLNLSCHRNGTSGSVSSPSDPKTKKIKRKKIAKSMRSHEEREDACSNSDLSRPRKSSKRNGKRGEKSSPELRPRRRASQTYFFKYQLARNPLKAEEEDLKLALLASLEQCNDSNSLPEFNEFQATNKQPQKHTHQNHQQPNQQQPQKHNQSQKHNNQTQKHKEPQKHHQKLEDIPTEPVPSSKLTNPSYDEEYLEKYRPETEDFLSFICLRITAPTTAQQSTEQTGANGLGDESNDSTSNTCTTPTTINNTGTNGKSDDTKQQQQSTNDLQNLKRSSSPQKLAYYSQASNSSPNHFNSSNRRRPTRQSPRLASTQKKISENDNSNHTAYDNFITYEEDMERACIALEDMAHEINGTEDKQKESVHFVQNASDCVARLSTSPFKNNKHLVKGLMTREFAGAFADEEIIFESISNHKL